MSTPRFVPRCTEPSSGLEPEIPSLPWKCPFKAFSLQITTSLAAVCVFYRRATAVSFVPAQGPHNSTPPWLGFDRAASRSYLTAAGDDGSGGIRRSHSTLSYGSLRCQNTHTLGCSELNRSGESARRVRAHPAPLHRIRSHPPPPSTGRSLPDPRGGDHRVLGHTRPAKASTPSCPDLSPRPDEKHDHQRAASGARTGGRRWL